MNLNDEAERMQFASMMGQLDVLFGKESSKVKAQLYGEALADIPIDVVRRGFERAKNTLDRYPTVAKWRQCCELEAREVDKRRSAELRNRLLSMAAHGASVNEQTGEIADPVYNCQVCQDRGWAYFDYHTREPLRCEDIPGRRGDHFVRKCACGHFSKILTRPEYAKITEDQPWNR